MEKKNRILSLIDFSKYSETVIRFTAEFSSFLQAEVMFIHQTPGLVPTRASTTAQARYLDAEKEEAYEKMKIFTDKYFQTSPSFIASEEDIVEILNSQKKDEYFDWVFIGLKGTGLLKKIFIGSKAIEIIENTDFLSVALPHTPNISLPEEIVVAVSPKYPVHTEQLKTVLSNLKKVVKRVTFISVVTEMDNEKEVMDSLERLMEEFRSYEPEVLVFKGNNAFHEIRHLVESKTGAFLVVQHGSRTLKDLLFRKYFINEVVYKGSIPLIVISK